MKTDILIGQVNVAVLFSSRCVDIKSVLLGDRAEVLGRTLWETILHELRPRIAGVTFVLRVLNRKKKQILKVFDFAPSAEYLPAQRGYSLGLWISQNQSELSQMTHLRITPIETRRLESAIP